MTYKDFLFEPFIDYKLYKYGFSLCKLPPNVYEDITPNISKIFNNFDKSEHIGSKLAGHLDKEYTIILPESFNEWLKGYVNLYNENSGYVDSFASLTPISEGMSSNQNPLQLKNMTTWINFQSKHEYNPLHIHSGVLSWVLWYHIPYSMEDEKKYGPGKYIEEKNNNRNANGGFSFAYPLGQTIQTTFIPVDKEWNGTIALFPSSLNHQVFPFYTSDEYRITLSGNIGLV